MPTLDVSNENKTTEAADETDHVSTTETSPKDTDLQLENKENNPADNDAKKKTKPVPAPLKLVHSHYTAHSKSTLPHILTAYGLEDKDHPQRKVCIAGFQLILWCIIELHAVG